MWIVEPWDEEDMEAILFWWVLRGCGGLLNNEHRGGNCLDEIRFHLSITYHLKSNNNRLTAAIQDGLDPETADNNMSGMD